MLFQDMAEDFFKLLDNYTNPVCAPTIRHLILLDNTIQNQYVVLSQTKTMNNVNINS